LSIEPDVQAARKLIDEVIDTFEKLEIVLHVHRTGLSVINTREIAEAISLSVDEVEKCVKTLRAQRVFEQNGPWGASLTALVDLYEDDRLEVLNYMTKKALARVRQDAARTFADAFVIKPRKKGDDDG
jgi:hypothetical protein